MHFLVGVGEIELSAFFNVSTESEWHVEKQGYLTHILLYAMSSRDSFRQLTLSKGTHPQDLRS